MIPVLILLFSLFSNKVNGDDFFPVGRVLNGVKTHISQAPYSILLTIKDITFHGRCGGVIISKKIVLTGGHCLRYENPKSYTVTAGATSVPSHSNEHKIAKYIVHPFFGYLESGDSIYDIGIIWLKKPLRFSNNIKPVKLPSYGETEPVGKMALVSGWGMTNPNNDHSLSSDLLVAYVEIMRRDDCKKKTLFFSEQMICAKNAHRGTCGGDSGGPLVVDGVLYGLTSFGPENCLNYGFYTNIAYFQPFIRQYME